MEASRGREVVPSRPRCFGFPQVTPARLPSGIGAQDAADRRGILDSAREDRINSLLERHPCLRKLRLLSLAGVRPAARQGGGIACEVDAQGLARSTRGVQEIKKDVPSCCAEASLLGEFPLRGLQRGLTRDIEEACRNLCEEHAYRVPVLADQQYPILIVDDDDSDRTQMPDDIPADGGVLPGHVLGVNRPHAPMESRC